MGFADRLQALKKLETPKVGTAKTDKRVVLSVLSVPRQGESEKKPIPRDAADHREASQAGAILGILGMNAQDWELAMIRHKARAQGPPPPRGGVLCLMECWPRYCLLE